MAVLFDPFRELDRVAQDWQDAAWELRSCSYEGSRRALATQGGRAPGSRPKLASAGCLWAGASNALGFRCGA